MTREQAKERFSNVWLIAFGLGLLSRLADPPRALRIALAVAVLAPLCWYGGWWLVLAVRDGSLRRAVPEYGWAFVGLLLIAAACGAVTLGALAIAGEPLRTIDVSSGAAMGTFLVLALWWLLRGRHGAAR